MFQIDSLPVSKKNKPWFLTEVGLKIYDQTNFRSYWLKLLYSMILKPIFY